MNYSPWRLSAEPQTWRFRILALGKSSGIHAFVTVPFLTTVLCFLPLTQSQDKALEPAVGEGLSPSPGWHEIPNTKLAPHCPAVLSIEGNSGCKTVISAWNGGVADTKRDRLIIWGGGHNAYYGNEVYALDLSRMAMLRLTEPSPATNVMSCPEEYPDGRPSARHTYGGLAYLAGQDKMFVYGGSKAACGFMSDGTWTLDLAKLEWKNMKPNSADRPANNPGTIAEHDPNSGMVFLSDTASLFRYDPAQNSYTRLKSVSGMDYHLSGVIDPGRKLFFMMGGPGQLWAIDIRGESKFAVEDWSHKVTGCEPLLYSQSPGLAYEPERKLIVGWAGGDTIRLFHPDTRTCSSETYSGGPGPAQANGTFGRFRYFPHLGVFILINDWKQDAFLLRLAPNVKPVATPTQPSNN